jgi:hypothetical protein
VQSSLGSNEGRSVSGRPQPRVGHFFASANEADDEVTRPDGNNKPCLWSALVYTYANHSPLTGGPAVAGPVVQ